MPYKSGTWGPEAQERSKRRIAYFHAYNNRRYELNSEEIKADSAKYYCQNREDILANLAKEYEMNSEEIKAKNTQYYFRNREAIRAKQAIYYQKKKLKK